MRALRATLGLVTLVVAPPIVLVTLAGSPLPAQLPTGAQLEAVLTRAEITDTRLLKIIAGLAWLVWLQLTAAIVYETISAARGRPARHLPGLGPAQRAAAKLLASALLLLSGTTRIAAAAPLTIPATPAPAVATLHTAPSPPVAITPERPTMRTYTTVRRDTLWSIAERLLGNGERWRDIAALNPTSEHHLSAGTVLRLPANPQPVDSQTVESPTIDTGPVITVEPGDSLSQIAAQNLGDLNRWPEIYDTNRDQIRDPNLIYAGQQLHLPTPADPPLGAANERVTVQPGDSLWSIAERHLGDPYRWPEIHDANRDLIHDPNLIEPGWTLALPAAANRPVVEPASEPPPPEATPPSPSVPPPPAASEPQPDPQPPGPTRPPAPSASENRTRSRGADDGSTPLDPVPAAIGAAGFLATAAVLIVNRRRARRERSRQPGERPPRPTREAAATETALRARADLPAEDWLDVALANLATQLGTRATPARPVAAYLDDDRLDVAWNVSPPPPRDLWVATAPNWWRLDRDADPERLVARAARCCSMPALVPIGETDSGALHLDVESIGSLSITGDPATARAVAAAVVLHLAGSRRADRTCTLLFGSPADVGLSVEALSALDEVTVCTEEHEVLTATHAHAHSIQRALDAIKCASTFEARASGRGDDLAPLVVIATRPLQAATAEALCADAGDGGRGVALLHVDDDPATNWQLTTGDPGTLVVPALGGLRVRVPLTSPQDAAALSEVLVAADRPLEHRDLHDDHDADEQWQRPIEEVTVVGASPEPDCPLLVRVLGPVDVIGSAEPLTGKSLELVAYLAVHPDGARRDQIEAALWPNLRINPTSFRNRISAARNALGRAPDGDLYLPHREHDLTRLHPAARTDIDQIRHRLDHSQAQDDVAAIETLTAALELVRGMPFEASTGYEWAIAEVHVAHATCLVGDTGLRLAELALTARDADRALWATGQALRAAPCNERLYQARMRAFATRGDPDAVEETMQTLIVQLETQDPQGDVHPDTWATYEQLGQGRHRQHAAAGSNRR